MLSSIRLRLIVPALIALAACSPSETSDQAAAPEAAQSAPAAPAQAPEPAAAPAPAALEVTEASFGCIRDLTPVRGFYVGNLLGNLDGTLAVANSAEGGVYPPGSVVQLIPTEVMVKHEPGYNAATKDWEFLELDVTPQGQTIRARGFVDVNNRFGLNCFTCHVAAQPQFDLICEETHGCAPIPLTADMFRGLQNTDPRCPAVDLPPEQQAALEALAALQAGPPPQ